MSRARFIAWPGNEHVAVSAMLTVAFITLFVVLYGGASLLSAVTPWRMGTSICRSNRAFRSCRARRSSI